MVDARIKNKHDRKRLVRKSKKREVCPSTPLRTKFSTALRKERTMTAREWFQKAQDENFAIGAFNCDSLDIFKAVCTAAQKEKSPVILEFSEGEVEYFGIKNIVDLVKNARDEYAVPLLLNLDHAKEVKRCLEAIEVGFDLIHFDGSGLSFEENIAKTKEVVDAAHKKNLTVEGEINCLPGSSVVHGEEIDMEEVKRSYTEPQKAAKFIAETGVDIFAAVFGNVHGTYPTQPDLDIDLLKKVANSVPNTFLSMHGGSGIPQGQVKEAIETGGIVKVNVNTEIRKAFVDALVQKTSEEPRQYTYYKMADDLVGAVAAVVEGKIDIFGSGGKADIIDK